MDARQLRPDVFSICGKGSTDEWIAFTAIVNIPSWKRSVRVVIIQHLDEEGKIKSHRIFFSTDTKLAGEMILLMYPARFQQEFLFRDAKQDLGLEHCQAYSAEKIDFHVNASLTVESLAKSAHHLLEDNSVRVKKELLGSFSIADVKTEYVNEHRALRILSMCKVDLNLPIIRKMMPAIREFGKRRV